MHPWIASKGENIARRIHIYADADVEGVIVGSIIRSTDDLAQTQHPGAIAQRSRPTRASGSVGINHGARESIVGTRGRAHNQGGLQTAGFSDRRAHTLAKDSGKADLVSGHIRILREYSDQQNVSWIQRYVVGIGLRICPIPRGKRLSYRLVIGLGARKRRRTRGKPRAGHVTDDGTRRRRCWVRLKVSDVHVGPSQRELEVVKVDRHSLLLVNTKWTSRAEYVAQSTVCAAVSKVEGQNPVA